MLLATASSRAFLVSSGVSDTSGSASNSSMNMLTNWLRPRDVGLTVDRIALGLDRPFFGVPHTRDVGDRQSFDGKQCHVTLGFGQLPLLEMLFKQVGKCPRGGLDLGLHCTLPFQQSVDFRRRQSQAGHQNERKRAFEQIMANADLVRVEAEQLGDIFAKKEHCTEDLEAK